MTTTPSTPAKKATTPRKRAAAKKAEPSLEPPVEITPTEPAPETTEPTTVPVEPTATVVTVSAGHLAELLGQVEADAKTALTDYTPAQVRKAVVGGAGTFAAASIVAIGSVLAAGHGISVAEVESSLLASLVTGAGVVLAVFKTPND